MKHVLLCSVVVISLAGCQSKPKQQDTSTETTLTADSAASLAKRPGPDAPRSAADRLVRALYFEHQKTDNPFRTITDRTLVEQFFTKSTAALIWVSKPAIKKELLFKAPDADIKKTWVEPAAVSGNRAIVYTTFEEKGRKKEIQVALIQTAGRWRIEEMTYPDGSRLTQLLE